MISDGRTGGSFTALQPDGKILADDARVRYNTDDSLDATYSLAPNLPSVVSAVVAPDGKIVLWTDSGTAFLLRSDGSLEANLGGGAQVSAIAMQTDGKVVMAGDSIVRVNRDGSRDRSFDPGTGPRNGSIRAVAVQADGKILVGGFFTQFDGTPYRGLARLNPNGTVDTSFFANQRGIITCIQPLPSGKTVAFSSLPDALFRLNADGSPDVTFGTETGSDEEIYALAVQPDGHVLAGGGFTSFNGVPFLNLVRIKPDGTLDQSFMPGAAALGTITNLAVQPDGKILLSGKTGPQSGALLRLNADGTPDPTFRAGQPKAPIFLTAARQADGRIVVAGGFTVINEATRPSLARLLPDGTLDASFRPSAPILWRVFNSEVTANSAKLAVLPNGAVVVGGTFTAVGTSPRPGIARFSANGALDASFNPTLSAGATIDALLALPDGRVVIGGNFSLVNGVSRGNLAALRADGSLDPAFGANGTNGPVRAFALRADGGVFVAGEFTTMAGQRRNNLAALAADGAFDPAFLPAQLATNDRIRLLTGLANGGVMVGFSRPDFIPGLQATYTLRRLRADGNFDPDFELALGANADISAVTVDALGRTLVGYTEWLRLQFGPVIQRHLMQRFTPSGTIDPAFSVGTGPSAPITSLLVEPDGAVLVGGGFSHFDDLTIGPLLRLRPAATSVASRLLNISTRGETGPGGNVLTAGFVLGGTAHTSVLVRATGPGLAAFGVGGAITDPHLALFRSDGTVVGTNDNWFGSASEGSSSINRANVAATGARVGAFALQSPLEAAFVATLAPGAYTAQVFANGTPTTGITLVEVYDASFLPSDRRLLNISTRGMAGPGGRTLIAGFVVRGSTSPAVLIRAIGPGLAPFGVGGALADPLLTIVNSAGATVAMNDDWSSSADKPAIAATALRAGAFALADPSKDSAVLLTLPPGSYTALVSGSANTTGVALVEVYEVP
ncbi:MAG: hypothetical protein JNK23_02770 [Opitutaceae bacterium]|nr:hypothetical protein [Opitutaceae bacterium]